MAEENNKSVFILWIVLNAILVIYAIGLFIYGKYFRKKEVLVFKDYVEGRSLYSNQPSLSHNEKNDNILDPKSENLISNQEP